MTAGRLAAAKPGATTNTTIYKCPTTVTGSTVLNVCNQSGSAATYRTALRDYEQVLHMSGTQASTGAAASPLQFTKGNPITAYKIKVAPGFSDDAAIPGTTFTTTNAATASILDVFKPQTDVIYYSIVKEVSQMALAAESQAGTFSGGETLTGATSQLTAVFRGGGDTELTLEMADVTTAATTFNISRNTGLADGMYLTLSSDSTVAGTEIVSINASGINTATNVLTVTRQALGSSSTVIKSGQVCNAWSASATVTTIDEGATYATGDQTLTVADSTGFVSGTFILIDNEILNVTDVAGNDITVERAQYGTGDVDHNNGATVTLLTDNGIYLANYFTEAETVSGGTSNASATLAFNTTDSAVINTKYLLSETQGSGHILPVTGIELRIGRLYKFDLSDSSNNNYPLKFSADDPEGTNGDPSPGTEYTAGVSKVGTAGTAGAFTSLEVGVSTEINLNAYADGSPAGSTTGVGFGLAVNETPQFDEIYIYDVKGEALTDADTFTINAVTYTIESSGVTAGPFGYVQSYDTTNAHLKITLGVGSTPFTAGTVFYDTPTLNNGSRTFAEVVTGKILSVGTIGAADGARQAGTYSITTTSGTTGSGTGDTYSIVIDGSGAATVTVIDGGKGHAVGNTITVNDSLLGSGGGAALTFNVASISTGIHTDEAGIYNTEDYVFYDKAIGANVTDKNSSLIVGPGQNLTVYSSAGDLSYVVTGFESASGDFDVVNMTKTSTGGDTP
tara:strand:+ start:236 stop:2443 length:2208 start_codon:yes stop_codon:yes gene_type:complete